MKFKNGLIRLLGGYTKEDYDSVSKNREKELDYALKRTKEMQNHIYRLKSMFFWVCDGLHNIGSIKKESDFEILTNNLAKLNRVFGMLRGIITRDSSFNNDDNYFLLKLVSYGFIEEYVSYIRCGVPIDSNLETACNNFLESLYHTFEHEESENVDSRELEEMHDLLQKIKTTSPDMIAYIFDEAKRKYKN